MKNAKGCLYLTYDGLSDPLGRSQILPYLERFAAKGISLTVVSFEKAKELSSCRRRLAQNGIRWIPLRYHKRPPVLSTCFDLLCGIFVCTWFSFRRPPRLVHARSFVAALLALWVKRVTHARFLYDVRGFWPEERVEGGLTRPNGFLYRCTKWWEARFFRAADGMVVLSQAAKDLLESRLGGNGRLVPITVIPTCTDLDAFAPAEAPNPTDLTRIVYVGSVGTWYLMEEMVRFFQELRLRIPAAFLTILTPRPDPILMHALRGLDQSSYDIRMVAHEEVPQNLRTMHVSLCFIKLVESKKASCPTKVGESLACGIPVVITRGVGDCDTLIERERVGVVVSDLTAQGYQQTIERLVALTREGKALRERCRRVAQDYFDLERGVERYLSFYELLLAGETKGLVQKKKGVDFRVSVSKV